MTSASSTPNTTVRRRRPRNSRLTTTSLTITALLLTIIPTIHGHNLRQSSSDASSSTDAIEFDYSKLSTGDDYGFETVSAPIEFEPLNTTTYYDRRQRRRALEMLFTDEDEEESGGDDIDLYEQYLDEEEVWDEEEEFVYNELETGPPKEYINNTTLMFVDPEEEPQGIEEERNLQGCGANSVLWAMKMFTDNYAYETSWKLEKVLPNNRFQVIKQGPPNPFKYADKTLYQGVACLPGDQMYKFTVMDAGGDGFCCKYGNGYYQYAVGGFVQYNSRNKVAFKKKKEHTFYMPKPTPLNNGNMSRQGQPGTAFSGRSGCGSSQEKITIEISTDNWGQDNTWILKRPNGQVALRGGPYPNGKVTTESKSLCVPHGTYTFTMLDKGGDGMCCKEGKGFYKIYIDNQRILYRSDFGFGPKDTHNVVVGYYTRLNNLGERQKQYLSGHNWRRKKYHERYGRMYEPLRYDLVLQQHAQNWANQLLNDCHLDGIKHEPGVGEGENLAKNMGSGPWGELVPVENINRRWFEREENWKWPQNAHWTQGTWHSARYMGCAESMKKMNNGDTCRIQVCRYARAGNCAMGQYDSNIGTNYLKPMFLDTNPCGPSCPGDHKGLSDGGNCH